MGLVKDEILAELIGMTLGDGNLGIYPKKKSKIPRCHYLRIYCNLQEKQYASEIERLTKTVFKKKCYIYERKNKNVLYIEISLKNLDLLLGIPIGDKIANKVRIPTWIYKNKKYIIACLRGLFDTDGCCYLTGKKYKIVNFTNRNKYLLKDIYNGLNKLGFSPYLSGGRNVEIGRQKEVEKFFNLIRPRNLKHYRYFAGVANVVTARV